MTSASSQSTTPACRPALLYNRPNYRPRRACRRTGNQLVISVSNARSLYGSRDAVCSVWRVSGPAIGERSGFSDKGETQSRDVAMNGASRVPRNGTSWDVEFVNEKV